MGTTPSSKSNTLISNYLYTVFSLSFYFYFCAFSLCSPVFSELKLCGKEIQWVKIFCLYQCNYNILYSLRICLYIFPYLIHVFTVLLLDLSWLLLFSAAVLLLPPASLIYIFSFNFSISLELLILLGTTSPHSTVVSEATQYSPSQSIVEPLTASLRKSR